MFVRRPAIGAVVVVINSSHRDGVAVDSHAVAKPINRRAVGGEQLGALRPARRQITRNIAREDVRRPALSTLVIVKISPHGNGVAADRHAVAEVLIRRAVGGEQLGPLRLARRQAAGDVTRESVRRPPVDAVIVV